MTESPATADPPMDELIGRVADEFMDRLARGERPTIEEYAQGHPEIAAILREVLPGLQAFGDLGAAFPDGDELGRGVLGDFRLLREVGRGGMGVVYEAEQLSLGRQVALKVLPFAAALDPRQLVRFRTEAQAAAQLHHEHIVPVYAVGCDRGVHYYAMQFIDGRSLAAALAQLRRSAAPAAADRSGESTGPYPVPGEPGLAPAA